jgi:hypothetical protein
MTRAAASPGDNTSAVTGVGVGRAEGEGAGDVAAPPHAAVATVSRAAVRSAGSRIGMSMGG